MADYDLMMLDFLEPFLLEMTKMMVFWLFFDYIISKQFNLETLSSLLKIVASCDDSIKVHKTCWEG